MDRERGFSLLEVLCATTILIVGLAALAQLVAVSTRINSSAKTTTIATLVAAQKMEQLRSLSWGFDNLGLPLSDAGLNASPPDSLKRNISSYCDFLDRTGRSLGGGASPPAGAAYISRWSVEPLPTDPANTLVLQVLVTASSNRDVDDTAGVRRLPDEALLVSVKTRKAK
jgi:type II secretory pathway pseudopilin PulG